MPGLDWFAFTQLAGAATRNWELLCRELVRRNYGRYGVMRSVAQQPGVEFHLELHETCDLGEPRRWWGWQCRWYQIPAGTQIGTTRRNKILSAIRTSERDLPSLTDWALWTVRALTPADQEWYEAIDTRLRLHQWTADNVEGLLSGDASILRETYFGELILNAARLERIHDLAAAPLRNRWDPLVHVEVGVEQKLNRVLGDRSAWPDLAEALAGLSQRSSDLVNNLAELSPDTQAVAGQLIRDLDDLQARTSAVTDAVLGGRLVEVRGIAAQRDEAQADPIEVRRAARTCRARSQPGALTLTAALDEVKEGDSLLTRLDAYLGFGLVAVIGDAGRGKTYLAAELTAPSQSRPAGVIIRGRDLADRGTLDDLARRVMAIKATSFEGLVAALDGAGARGGCRVPIVIDGLNEAENPRDWKDLLAPLPRLLEDYPHVLVVVTLRSVVAGDALPDETPQIELHGFRGIEADAVSRYFEYYKIDAGSARLPLDRLSHPLFLRLFCDATNPDRAEWVGVEAIPANLDAVFAAYRDVAVDRVASDLRRHADDVSTFLSAVALELWERRARTLPFAELRRLAGDDALTWDLSLARALEEEGVLLREGGADDQRSELLFDAFAGFLIADVLTARYGAELPDYLKSEPASGQIAVGEETAHPLARDIIAGLGGVMPRVRGQQLWPLVKGAAKVEALRVATELHRTLLDPETVEEIAAYATSSEGIGLRLFDRLEVVRAAVNHPLNARFLDRLLAPLAVAERDHLWSEWVRRHEREISRDLRDLAAAWGEPNTPLDGGHACDALWATWLLTSTVRPLRDAATYALFRYGRSDPGALFDLALSHLDANDPYVPERLLAASYGTVMANQIPSSNYLDALARFLVALDSRLHCDSPMPMPHWLSRQYIRGIFEAALKLHPDTLAAAHVALEPHFAAGAPPTPIVAERRSEHEVGGAFRMDFENYTVGGLVRDRRNYDFDHREYQDVLSSVRGRVWELGWRADRFEQIDREIGRSSGPTYERGHRTERYGKKYGWIAFYEAAGRLEATRRHDELNPNGIWVADVDIDPSFPSRPGPLPIGLAPWASMGPARDEQWVKSGPVDVPDRLLRAVGLAGDEGRWLLSYGYLLHRDEERGRDVFGFLRVVLVPEQLTETVLDRLGERRYLGNDLLPREPDLYYTYAGEIPWSDRFVRGLVSVDGDPLYRQHLRDGDNGGPIVEILTHGFSWESYHSALNDVGGVSVPSAALSRHFNLRSVPQGFDQVERDGTPASLTFAAPDGFEGHLVYIREDLVRDYAASNGCEIVVTAWGEREVLRGAEHDPPVWMREAYDNCAMVWRRTALLEELTV